MAAACRSLKLPDFPIRGYEYYDYRDDVVNTTFVNFQDNKVRKTGALSFLMFTSAGLSTGSSISGAKYVNAKPVYFPKYDSRFDNDNRGGNQYRTLSIHDLDGSTTGVPDSHIMLNDGENDSVVTDNTCQINPTWNASVCKGDIGRLNLSDSERRVSKSGQPRIPDRPLRPGGFGRWWERLKRSPRSGPTCRSVFPSYSAGAHRADSQRQGIQDLRRREHCEGRYEIQVKTERPEVTLSLAELHEGSWVIFKFPGFAKAASGAEESSLNALRQANETSWFRDGDTLWVKLVAGPPVMQIIRPTDLQASITVSR